MTNCRLTKINWIPLLESAKHRDFAMIANGITRGYDNLAMERVDLCLEVFLQLYKREGVIETRPNGRAYAIRTAQNRLTDLCRRQASRPDVDSPAPIDAPEGEEGEPIGTSEVDRVLVGRFLGEQRNQEAVEQALSVLSPRERQIVSERFGLGGSDPLTNEEIGAKHDLSKGYISTLCVAALAKLRQRGELRESSRSA